MIRNFFAAGAGCLVLACSAFPSPAAGLDEQTRVQIEALNRLKGLDLESNPALKSAVLKIVEKTRGTPQFVELVRDFNLQGQSPALLDYALTHPGESAGVEAFRLALKEQGPSALEPLLQSTNAPAAVRLLGSTGEKQFQPLLQSIVTDSAHPAPVRKEAVRALAKSEDGARFLLALAREGTLPPDVRLAASSELNLAPWPKIKKEALDLLPLPQSATAEPLPPISELATMKGDPRRGKEIFASETAACISCHQVHGQGIDFGPSLSEIGTKLGRDALYESILDPTAGISFGYEAWDIELQNGDEAFGLIVSETPDELALKTQNGIVTKYKKDEIIRRQKLSTSIMPAGLQLTMSTQDLVDLVEYLSTLRKPK